MYHLWQHLQPINWLCFCAQCVVTSIFWQSFLFEKCSSVLEGEDYLQLWKFCWNFLTLLQELQGKVSRLWYQPRLWYLHFGRRDVQLLFSANLSSSQNCICNSILIISPHISWNNFKVTSNTSRKAQTLWCIWLDKSGAWWGVNVANGQE